jgi:hypothetical protein
VSSKFGRVDAENNVYVTDAGVERHIGQYAIGTAEEAMAFFERKFADLEAQVRILEQRLKSGVDPKNLKAAFTKVTADLVSPNALGDLQQLRDRVAAIAPKIEEAAAAKAEENKEVVAAAIAAREALVAKAEALAAQDPAKVIWKSATATLTELFNEWQAAQKSGPRLPKAEADSLWKRFSQARTKVEAAKRTFFATADAQAKTAKATKSDLVAKAQALVAKGADAVAEYRKLLDAWKLAGRTNPKTDDALWAQFKAAGDAIYAAKGEQVAVTSASQAQAYEAKLELLAEAAAIDPEKDLTEAKRLLASIQERWEKAGRVAREQIPATEEKLRTIEAAVRKAEAEHWRANDPAAKARKSDAALKIEEALAKLETELADAKAKGDKKKSAELEESIAARKSWLAVVAQ